MPERDGGLRAEMVAELEEGGGGAGDEIAEEGEGVKADEEGRGGIFDDVLGGARSVGGGLRHGYK